MTFEELLRACGNNGRLPEVVYNGKIGKVTTIRDNGLLKGCSVNLGKDYDDWFHDSESTDKRSKYMRDLTLNNSESQ